MVTHPVTLALKIQKQEDRHRFNVYLVHIAVPGRLSLYSKTLSQNISKDKHKDK